MFNTEDEILRRLQEKNLEMAVMFYHWCQRNHLTCYLCGGGCIGAIRHGGFIPWALAERSSSEATASP